MKTFQVVDMFHFQCYNSKKCLWISCVSIHRSASNWAKLWLIGVLSHTSASSTSPPWQRVVADLTALSHIKQQTWVREWEHLGGGKRDESQSQLVSAYAALNNAPFQMVNLLNPRLPLAPSTTCQKSPWQRIQGLTQGCDDWGATTTITAAVCELHTHSTCLCSSLKDEL